MFKYPLDKFSKEHPDVEITTEYNSRTNSWTIRAKTKAFGLTQGYELNVYPAMLSPFSLFSLDTYERDIYRRLSEWYDKLKGEEKEDQNED